MSQDHFTIRDTSGLIGAGGGSDFIALTQVAALCNRAEFKADQVCIFGD